jgi:hypothetical protein
VVQGQELPRRCSALGAPLKRGVRRPMIVMVFLLLEVLAAAWGGALEPCRDQLVQEPLVGKIIIRVRLEKASARPPHIYGLSDYAMLYVVARVQRILKGEFSIREQESFGLAVHSIALTFGYDYVGEVFEVALNPRGKDDYDLTGIRLAPDARTNVFLQILRRLDTPPKNMIHLSSEANRFYRVRVLDVDPPKPPFVIGKELNVGLRDAPNGPELSSHICVVIAIRQPPVDRPFRRVRLIYGYP